MWISRYKLGSFSKHHFIVNLFRLIFFCTLSRFYRIDISQSQILTLSKLLIPALSQISSNVVCKVPTLCQFCDSFPLLERLCFVRLYIWNLMQIIKRSVFPKNLKGRNDKKALTVKSYCQSIKLPIHLNVTYWESFRLKWNLWVKRLNTQSAW